MLCVHFKGKTGWFRDFGLHGKTKTLCAGRLVSGERAGEGVRMETGSASRGNSMGKAPRAQLGREKQILVFCRSIVVRRNAGG